MLTLLMEGDKMKEKVIKNKWVIAIMSIIILNLIWIQYSHTSLKRGILIEENEPSTKVIEIGKEEDKVQEDISAEVLQERKQLSSQDQETQIDHNQEEVCEVPIYICGAIQKPGVYYVSKDAIINDVIIKGGGLTQEADATAINLACPIQAHEKIIIPKQGEKIDKFDDSYENRERIEMLPSSQLIPQPSEKADIVKNSENSELININIATKEELMTLSGIGEVKAEAIIVYRQENGEFKSIDEMKQISGIGEKTFDKIKQFITT